jgi:hypothetical protein
MGKVSLVQQERRSGFLLRCAVLAGYWKIHCYVTHAVVTELLNYIIEFNSMPLQFGSHSYALRKWDLFEYDNVLMDRKR